jgi:hypothetical protein
MRKPKRGDLVLVKGSLDYGDPPLQALKNKLVKVKWVEPKDGNDRVDVCSESDFLLHPKHYVLVNFCEYYDTLQKMW